MIDLSDPQHPRTAGERAYILRALVDPNTEWNGNDFAIDNMTLEEQMPATTTKSTWGEIKDAYR